MTKKELRKKIKILKKELLPKEINSLSEKAIENLMNSPEFARNSNIYVYVNYNQEIVTSDFIRECLRFNKNVFVPKIWGEHMIFVQIRDINELIPGAFGILEPYSSEADIRKSGLLVMPLLAVDECFNRLGYGGGYYDRYLAKEHHHITVGLAYDFQLVPEIETDEFDIPIDMIVTPTKVLRKNVS